MLLHLGPANVSDAAHTAVLAWRLAQHPSGATLRRPSLGHVAWLLRDGEVLASLEVADTRSARRKGLLGRDGVDGALLLPSARSVHSFGMRFPIDVAWCDRDLHVLRVARLPRNRMTRSVLRASAVLEAEAGAFARWNLAVGDHLELQD